MIITYSLTIYLNINNPKEKPVSCESGFWYFSLMIFYVSEIKKAVPFGTTSLNFYILNLMVLECV